MTGETGSSRVERLRFRLASALILLGVGLALAMALAATFGASDVKLWQRLLGGELSPAEEAILFTLRLPRVVAAAAVGGLAGRRRRGVPGAAAQSARRSVHSRRLGRREPRWRRRARRRRLGACSFRVRRSPAPSRALVVIERVATVGGRLSVFTLLLTGAIFNAASAALIYFLQSLASHEELQAIVFYLMGRVPALGSGALAALVGVGLAVTIALFASGRDYNALTTGEEGAATAGRRRRAAEAAHLRARLARHRARGRRAGMIGFAGLVVPHLLRQLLGPDHRLLLPASFLGGASFLVLADLASRTLVAPTELPVGVVTALVGGPLFLIVLRRRGGGVHGDR